MNIKRIIVLFKTHLDIGFTDRAERVVQNYMEEYIPQAMRVARQLRGEKEGFVWTTGSWLINRYLEEGRERTRLEEAIEFGEIRWHGLPFTTHTELMNPDLFRYGLQISQELDRKYGKKTIAAKLTDVPGHTRGIIPLLSEAEICFLHIGVNPASFPPNVPSLFRWKAPEGEQIFVMYHHDYGEMTEIGRSGCAVYFAHTGDNHGPQSADSIRALYQKLHEDYPQAEIKAGNLEDVAQVVIQEQDLPVVEGEIGDTWIHGVSSDPWKVSAFRALLRVGQNFPEKERKLLYRELIIIPEHTWGMDEKTCLGNSSTGQISYGEHESFSREEFEHIRNSAPFLRLENSWKEQRDYLRRGVENLSFDLKAEACSAIGKCKRVPAGITGLRELEWGKDYEIRGYSFQIGENGAMCSLVKDGKVWADPKHPMGLFYYEVFSEQEYDRFYSQYLINRPEWALEDFGKIGMKNAIDSHRGFHAHVRHIYKKEDSVIVRMELPSEAVSRFGGMELLEMEIRFQKDEVQFDFAWFGKHACRIAEASWLLFSPPEQLLGLEKLGKWISPLEVVDGGNQRLHAVENRVRFEELEMSTIDAPLVNVGSPSLLNFFHEKPSLNEGISVNLHNNVWGTNFPMWYEEDARFRFQWKKV